jgi:thioredoxin-dependent peroxiredoxin
VPNAARLRLGDRAPGFSLPDETGRPRSLDELCRAGPLVLFFYPMATSLACTRECRAFRDRSGEFATFGASRVGISPDTVDTQEQFAQGESLGYPLLSDRDGTVATAYGVRRAFGPLRTNTGFGALRTRRKTFVIGADERILGIIASETRMDLHAERALEILGAAAAHSA